MHIRDDLGARVEVSLGVGGRGGEGAGRVVSQPPGSFLAAKPKPKPFVRSGKLGTLAFLSLTPVITHLRLLPSNTSFPPPALPLSVVTA